MKVLEKLVRSKSGREEDCEDALVVTPHYACAVDGATTCTGRRWTKNNWTSGKWAARTLCDAVLTLAPNEEPPQVINALTASLGNAYHEENAWQTMKNHPEERATASVVLYSFLRNELIMVGDCQAAVVDGNGSIAQRFQPTKFVDQVTAQARAMYLQSELLLGKRRSQLAHNDTGRDYIRELLMRQRVFQNNPEAPAPFQCWVLDGFPVKEECIVSHSVPKEAREIILATDGYPQIFATLTETESHIKTLVENDPLLINKHPCTKGLQKDAESFDDRTYLRFCLD